MWASPKPKFKPAVWRFAAAKTALDQAGEFVPVEQAERRNLIMVNPIEGNIYATSRNIVAAYQMVKAGETARSHRHTAAALRLVVQAKQGIYTVSRRPRRHAPGEVVLTLSWCWHGHANESDATSYWIDFLDIPFVQHRGDVLRAQPAGFEKDHPQRSHAEPIPAREAWAGDDAKDVEIAGRAVPTTGLQPAAIAVRQPAPNAEDHGELSRVRQCAQGARSKAGPTKASRSAT